MEGKRDPLGTETAVCMVFVPHHLFCQGHLWATLHPQTQTKLCPSKERGPLNGRPDKQGYLKRSFSFSYLLREAGSYWKCPTIPLPKRIRTRSQLENDSGQGAATDSSTQPVPGGTTHVWNQKQSCSWPPQVLSWPLAAWSRLALIATCWLPAHGPVL